MNKPPRKKNPTFGIAVFIVVAVLFVIATLFYNAIKEKRRVRQRQRAGGFRFIGRSGGDGHGDERCGYCCEACERHGAVSLSRSWCMTACEFESDALRRRTSLR